MKIIVLSSHTKSLFWFRLDMMKSFVRKGYEVIAVGSESESKWKRRFEENLIDYRQIAVQRNGLNPIMDLRTYFDIKALINNEKPDRIFAYQAKTIIYGAIAAKSEGVSEVYSLVAGLGSIFRGSGLRNYIIRTLMKTEYKIAFTYSKKVIFQNVDDRDLLLKMNLVKKNKTAIINGSGVNLEIFQPASLPKVFAFLFIGRLLQDKGIYEYLEACRIVKSRYPGIRCLLVGPFDSNPTALSENELEKYIRSNVIEFFGEQIDVKPYIRSCSVFVLPSYHEGTPKTVLEAMAMGRAIITTDTPGCRETVKNGQNGYLVQPKCISKLVEKMELFINNPHIVQQMGSRSVDFARACFDVNLVNLYIMNIMNC